MTTLALRRFELCVTLAALLAGCGGSQPPIGAPGAVPQSRSIVQHAARGKSWMLPGAKSGAVAQYQTKSPLLYVGNFGNQDVTVYRATVKDPAPLATISDDLFFPDGACIDGHGMLYVTNLQPSGGGWVSEYPLGKTTPSRIITDGINSPAYCAIDTKGNLWVANAFGPNVTEYLYGKKKPHTVITKGLLEPVGVAIDSSGNLYVGNGPVASQHNVEVYAPGSESPSRTITDGVTSPMGLTVDANGILYVPNLNENNVEEYRSGQSAPFQTITQAMDEPAGVTVDKKGTLYVSNIASGAVVEFAPGSLKPLKRQISKGLNSPQGIAYYPPLLP
jgi:sugar lactone lactonase YvrE